MILLLQYLKEALISIKRVKCDTRKRHAPYPSRYVIHTTLSNYYFHSKYGYNIINMYI